MAKTEPKSIEDQLKDVTESLAFSQQFIKGLENLLGDIFPGWDKYEDDELPDAIQAFHLKYRRMEERSEAAGKACEASTQALVDRSRRWDEDKLRMKEFHGEAMAKLAAELEQAKKERYEFRKVLEELIPGFSDVGNDKLPEMVDAFYRKYQKSAERYASASDALAKLDKHNAELESELSALKKAGK